MKHIVFVFIISLILLACEGSNDIKEIKDLKSAKWPIAQKVIFDFEIKDTTKLYQINYLVRNSIEYPYYNIYLNQVIKDPKGNRIAASMDELILFDKKTGKPLGDGLGDIFDNKFTSKVLKNLKFSKPGKYHWIISHNMRPDPLEGIMSMGIEVLIQK